MKRSILALYATLFIYIISFAQIEAVTFDGTKVLLYENNLWYYADSVPLYYLKTSNISKLEIPKTNPDDVIINYTGFSLLYNEKHEQASWVAYKFTKEKTNKVTSRTDRFVTDHNISTGSATNKDYTGSGYDRGHLAPASDMSWSEQAMEESFYYSNISPQDPGFNRGEWSKLESLVAKWAVNNNMVYVVTGPVLTPGLPVIGINKVSVPQYFYKVILDYTQPGIKGIGFIVPNKTSNEPLQNFAVTIDSVERITGIDFFYKLPDDQEELIESNICLHCWMW